MTTTNTSKVQAVETTNPRGERAMRVTCNNPKHWHAGMSAIVTAPVGRTFNMRAVCGLITLAHDPGWGQSPIIKARGPWPA